MFIVFLINNKINNFFVNNLDSDNDLKSKHIDSFIDDYIFSIQQSEKLNFFLQERELNFIKKSMEKYLYSFTNKAKYPDYKSIVNELLKNTFIYTDIYSLVLEFIDIINKTKNYNIIQDNPIIYLLSNLFKKVLIPQPEYRVNSNQMSIIINFVINYIKNIENNFDDLNKIMREFYKNFNNILNKNNIQVENFYLKDFGFIDFNKLITLENINYIKKLNL